MRFEGTKTTAVRIGKPMEEFVFQGGNGLFSRKFKNNSDFILNSGNFYLTLQLELCPYVSQKTYLQTIHAEDKTLFIYKVYQREKEK